MEPEICSMEKEMLCTKKVYSIKKNHMRYTNLSTNSIKSSMRKSTKACNFGLSKLSNEIINK